MARESADFTIHELTTEFERYDQFAAPPDRTSEVDGAQPLDFPAKLKPLWIPKRYKIIKGGRGGAKSWGVARALLIMGCNRTLRIGCFREVQKNLKESVHQLLKDQIEAMDLGEFYEVTAEEIRGSNGTLFVFAGLSVQTAASVKSYEGLDIAWVEEAQTVRARSWKILIPTIRKAGSEIWITMNPELETDATYVMFVENPMEGESICITINYRDNPWFPKELEKERAHAKRHMKPDEYNNIWLGLTRNAVEGAIFADEISEAMEQGRLTNVPYDYRLKVHVILDLGWNDKMFSILAQRGVSEMRVIRAYEDDHITLATLSAKLKLLPYNWGRIWLPHDGAHGDFKTGKSTHTIMKELDWRTGVVPNVPIETGIKRARLLLERTYFDKKNALPLTTALRRYKRNLNQKSEEYGQPLHDAASHGGDAYRYLSLVAEKMNNANELPELSSNNVATYPLDTEMGM
jgi:phage terminase large subunit